MPEIANGEHIINVGTTGCGKSFLIQNLLLNKYDPVIVFNLDPLEDKWDRYIEYIVKDLKTVIDMYNQGARYFIYTPEFKNFDDLVKKHEELCEYMLKSGIGWTIINDEITDVSDANYIADYHFQFIRGGRKKKLTYISGSQRPQMIHKHIWSQSRHKFIFQNDDYDIKKFIFPYVGTLAAKLILKLKKYEYVYVNSNKDVFIGRNDSLNMTRVLKEGENIVPGESDETGESDESAGADARKPLIDDNDEPYAEPGDSPIDIRASGDIGKPEGTSGNAGKD